MSRVQSTLMTVQGLLSRGQTAQARDALVAALKKDPRDPMLLHALAVVCNRLGQFDRAIEIVLPLLKSHAQIPDVHHTFGVALRGQGKTDDAVASFRQAADRAPKSPHYRREIARTLLSTPRAAEALDEARRALDLAPDDPETLSVMFVALNALGLSEEQYTLAEQALGRHPANLNAAIARAFAGNYLSRITPQESYENHAACGAILQRAGQREPGTPPLTPDTSPDRPLTIGFLSQDLCTHPVAFFLEPLLDQLDRDRFTIAVYSATLRPDARTDVLRSKADLWRDIAGMPGPAIAKQIRADRVDILIELGGLTSAHLLAALTPRAAPIQATYLGYPNTTGLPGVDYRIVDTHTDPPGAESWCTERPARLDPCFLCHRPEPSAPTPKPLGVDRRPVTFGSFNTIQKLSDATVPLWSAVLKHVDGSRLFLKSAALDDARVCDAVASRFAAHGIARDRLVMRGRTPTLAEHFAAYDEIDVALDPTPYGGTTTTCDALWMGVPVVTLAGRTHASRVGVSLLHAVGHAEWVARDDQEYIELAARLANNRPMLADLRSSLRPTMASSTLCDAQAFARRFESMLRQWWRTWGASSSATPAGTAEPGPGSPDPRRHTRGPAAQPDR